jgi:hypothetical protein
MCAKRRIGLGAWFGLTLAVGFLQSQVVRADPPTVDFVAISPPQPTSYTDVSVRVSFHTGSIVGTHTHTISGSSIVVNLAQDGISGIPPPHFDFTESLGRLAPGTYQLQVVVDPNSPFYERYVGQFSLVVAEQADATIIPAVEFYNKALDHFFLTASPQEIAILDAGIIGGWSRTGQQFNVNVGPVDGTEPVCRYYIPPPLGNSHFFSAFSFECDILFDAVHLGDDPTYAYTLETLDAFYVVVPDQFGRCPTGRIPVYRLWNQRPDSNHRYTTSLQVRDEMLGMGYASEGYGMLGVGMCAVP